MEFNLEPVDLKSLVEQSIEDNKAYGEQFNVEFVLKETSTDVKVNADSDRLQQVMANLLSNAAKFSPPDSEVKVSVTRREGNVKVSVEDRGPGIPVEFHGQIFQKFTQVNSSESRERKGTGLGLSIAKLIVEKHGGGIDFESELNKGTTFYFELPEWQA